MFLVCPCGGMNADATCAIRTRLSGRYSSSFQGSSTRGKDEKRAVELKEQGNIHFKRKELGQSLYFYSKAAFLSPWPSNGRQRILSQLLSCMEPSKHHIATKLFSEENGCDSSNLAACIGNRSAVLYEMNQSVECLDDIELALSLEFPASSVHKLYRRRACCLAQLGNRAGSIEALETSRKKFTHCTSFSQVKKDQLIMETKTKIENLLRDHQHCDIMDQAGKSGYESSSNAIVRDASPTKGRFLRATRPLKAGEAVMSEKAYAAVLNFDQYLTHCSYCFHKTSALIPCCWCTYDGYCSRVCREKAWVEYHWLECSVTHLWVKADWMMRVALRMAVTVPANVLLGAISREVDDTEVYASVLSLVLHEDEYSDTQQKAMFAKMADTLVECFGDVIKEYLHDHITRHPNQHPPDSDQDLDAGLRTLLLHHLLQLRCNSHSVTSVVEEGGNGSEGGGEEEKVVQSTGEIQVGSVIYPTASLFNHSCWPNIIFRFVGSTVVAIATRPIEKGEEINNCYGPQVGRMKRTERLTELERKYYFQCSCPACDQSDASLEYRELVVDAYLCPECGGALIGRGPMAHWQCHDCNRMLDSHNIERMQELMSETERMFSTAHNDRESDVALLLKCHVLQSRVLHKHNLQLARTSDAVAHAYAGLGEFRKAAEFCSASCRAVEAVHGDHSIELATELHKLIQLYFNGCQFDKALDIIEKALPLLRVFYHPPNHSDITELEKMKNHLTKHS